MDRGVRRLGRGRRDRVSLANVNRTWRVLAHKVKGRGCEFNHRFEPKDGMEFDELVVGDWFHMEQMNTRDWWIGIGRGGNLVMVNIHIPAKGQVEVYIEDESAYGAPSAIKRADVPRAAVRG